MNSQERWIIILFTYGDQNTLCPISVIALSHQIPVYMAYLEVKEMERSNELKCEINQSNCVYCLIVFFFNLSELLWAIKEEAKRIDRRLTELSDLSAFSTTYLSSPKEVLHMYGWDRQHMECLVLIS